MFIVEMPQTFFASLLMALPSYTGVATPPSGMMPATPALMPLRRRSIVAAVARGNDLRVAFQLVAAN